MVCTVQDLKDAVEKCDASLEIDSVCYRATAPRGFCWEPGLHELVANFGRLDGTEAQAREELIERVKILSPLKKCCDPECDWCKEGACEQ